MPPLTIGLAQIDEPHAADEDVLVGLPGGVNGERTLRPVQLLST